MNARIIFEVKKSCLTLLNVAKSSCSRVVNLEILKKSSVLKNFDLEQLDFVAKSITGLEKKIEKEDEVFDSFGYEAKCPW